MKSTLRILAALLALSTLNLTADTVDSGQIVTFNAGDPATAADMNQTIQALVTAINDNAAKLSPSLDDSSWKIIVQTIALGLETVTQITSMPEGGTSQSTTDTVGHVIEYIELTITLNSNGSFSGTTTGSERSVNLVDDEQVSSDLSYQNDNPVNEGIAGTWSLSGNTLTVTIPDPVDGDEIFNFTLSASADMLVSIDGSLDTYEGTTELQTSTMMIGVRTTTAP